MKNKTIKKVNLLATITLFFYFNKEMLISNFFLLIWILNPWFKARPAVLDYRLTARSPINMAIFANMISMIPGTMYVSELKQGSYFRVHMLNANSIVQLSHILKEIEKRILAAFPEKNKMILMGYVLIAVSILFCLWRFILGPSLWDRVMATGLIANAVTLLLFLGAIQTQMSWFLDSAIVLNLFSYLGIAVVVKVKS